MLEKNVVASIRKSIKNKYPQSQVNKIHGGQYQSAGISDLLCCIEGRYVAIEVKTPKTEKNLSVLQKEFIDNVVKAGGIAFMASSATMALDKLENALQGKDYTKY